MAATDAYDPELTVVEAVCEGDRYAFEELVRRQDRWVRGVVFGVLGRTDRIDDVAQQVWLGVWQRARELRDPTRWRAWLYRLARNAAIDAGRETTRRRGLSQPLPDRVGVDVSASAEDGAVQSEAHRAMLAAIAGLPALYREPFVLRHLNGWSYQEIGELMGLPVDSVETRLVRARRMRRVVLKDKVGWEG